MILLSLCLWDPMLDAVKWVRRWMAKRIKQRYENHVGVTVNGDSLLQLSFSIAAELISVWKKTGKAALG